MIFFFVNLFDQQQEVCKFRSGTITAQRLSYFRELDPDEGTLFMHPTGWKLGDMI